MLLGAPVGWDDDKISSILQRTLDETTPIFQSLLLSPLSTQEAMHILRVSTLPTLGYLMRVVPPRLLSDTCRAFDKLVLEVAAKKLGLPELTERTAKQTRLKLRNSGLGLQSTEQTSPIAFACAFIASHDLLSEPIILGKTSLHPDSQYRHHVVHAINETRSQVAGRANAAEFVPPASDLSGPKPSILQWIRRNQSGAAELPRKLQHVFSHASDLNRFDALFSSSCKADQARLKPCSVHGNAAWLGALPTSIETRMSKTVMRLATRIRLGVQLFDGKPYDCICGEANGKAGADPLHALSCIKIRRTEVNVRHNNVAQKLYQAAVRAGCIVQKETQSWDSQERVDLEIITPAGERLIIDVTVVQPTAPSFSRARDGPHNTTLFAANFASKQKCAKYSDMTKQQEAEFIAAAAEIFGGLTPATLALAKRICNFATRTSCPWTHKELYANLISAIAVAIQIGNAHCAMRVHAMNVEAGRATKPIIDFSEKDMQLDAFADSDSRLPEHEEQPTPPASPRVVVRIPAHSNTASPAPASPKQPALVSPHRSPALHDGFGVVDEKATPLQANKNARITVTATTATPQRDGFGIVDERPTPVPQTARFAVNVHARNAEFDQLRGVSVTPLRAQSGKNVHLVLPSGTPRNPQREFLHDDDPNIGRFHAARSRAHARANRGQSRRARAPQRSHFQRVLQHERSPSIDLPPNPRTPSHSVESVIVVPTP